MTTRIDRSQKLTAAPAPVLFDQIPNDAVAVTIRNCGPGDMLVRYQDAPGAGPNGEEFGWLIKEGMTDTLPKGHRYNTNLWYQGADGAEFYIRFTHQT